MRWLLLSAILFIGCTDAQMLRAVKAKNPNCDVLDIDSLGGGLYEATVQCPGARVFKTRFFVKK